MTKTVWILADDRIGNVNQLLGIAERLGTEDEIAKLDASYAHLCKMRDELVTLGIVPAIEEWSKINPNL